MLPKPEHQFLTNFRSLIMNIVLKIIWWLYLTRYNSVTTSSNSLKVVCFSPYSVSLPFSFVPAVMYRRWKCCASNAWPVHTHTHTHIYSRCVLSFLQFGEVVILGRSSAAVKNSGLHVSGGACGDGSENLYPDLMEEGWPKISQGGFPTDSFSISFGAHYSLWVWWCDKG